MRDHKVADAELLLQKCIPLNIRKYFQRRWKGKDNHPNFRPRLGYYHPTFEGISIWATPPSSRTNCHRSQSKHFQIHIGYTLNWHVLIRHVQRISAWVRLSIFSPLSIIQYLGLYGFSLPIAVVMIEIIYVYFVLLSSSNRKYELLPIV